MKFGVRRKQPININITSLIDVLFLLLIFFLVTSTFMEHPALELDLPEASSASSLPIHELVISVAPDETILIRGKAVSLDGLPSALDEARAERRHERVILKADRKVPYGIIIRIMETVRKSGFKKIVALTRSPSQELRLQ